VKYSQVNRYGLITHRAFTEDPNFQPEVGSRILPDPELKSNATHLVVAVQPVPEDATEIIYSSESLAKEEDSDLSNEEKIRGQRDIELITKVDSMNPIYWATLTSEQQQEWIDYRQALLDVPQQEGFPLSVNWPSSPSTKSLKSTIKELHLWSSSFVNNPYKQY
jgi:hypothetical protein